MNNPYRAYWEKAQEESIKLGQFYTPECLVELCLELLQPKGELYDPCCGLGSFLLKVKAKDESLKISGNDVDAGLQVPFPITFGDYLNSEAKEYDYIIANPPFNQKKTHCQLADENYCWINKIITQTRKKTLIILPSNVNSCLNPKLTAERVKIIESGNLELVCQLPSHLFNQTGIAPCIWLINKEKTEKSIYFLNAEKFSQCQNKQRFLSEENIQQICQKENWNLVSYEKIKENGFFLVPLRYEYEKQDFKLPTEEEKKELDEKIRANQKELYMLTQELVEAVKQQHEQMLKEMDKDPDYLSKADSAWEKMAGREYVDANWLLSGASKERLQQELATLINEYYQLWVKIGHEINVVLKSS